MPDWLVSYSRELDLAVDEAEEVEWVSLLKRFGQQSGGKVLVADWAEEAIDCHGTDGGGSAVGGGGEGSAMDHGIAHFNAGWKTIDEDTSGFAFEDGE